MQRSVSQLMSLGIKNIVGTRREWLTEMRRSDGWPGYPRAEEAAAVALHARGCYSCRRKSREDWKSG